MPTIQFRTDEETKAQSNIIFKQLGITMSDAINIFLHQTILQGGIPFELKIPRWYNETTVAAFKDMEESKAKGIQGRDVQTVLAELKENNGEDML